MILLVTGLSGSSLFGQNLNVTNIYLSRKEAVKEALAHNPGITVARELMAEAKAQISIATALPDPTLVSEMDQLKNFWSPSSSSERDIGVQFTVPNPYRVHLNGNVARAAWKAAEFSLAQIQQQIASQTAQAYDAFLVARRHRDDLTQGKEIAAQFLEKTKARFRAGTVAKLDTIKAQVDLSKAENDLIANEKTIATSLAALNRLLGRPLHTRLEATDVLTIPGPFPELFSLEQIAFNSRPELLSMVVQQKGAHDATKSSKLYWAPDFNFTLWRSYIDGAPDSYKFDGGVTFPLFFWQHQKGQLAQAQHHELELKASHSDLESQVMVDVNTSYATATTAFRQAIFLRDSLLPEAQEAFKITFNSYGLGGASALDLLDAKTTLLGAESDYTDALGAVNDAAADLERAIGAPLPPVAPETSHEK